MKAEIGKRYFLKTIRRGSELVSGRVIGFVDGYDSVIVKLDYWEGVHVTNTDNLLSEDNRRPNLIKKLLGMHA
jgi:hypothetical protein